MTVVAKILRVEELLNGREEKEKEDYTIWQIPKTKSWGYLLGRKVKIR